MRSSHIPKPYRMPDAPDGVKVEGQVMDGVKDGGQPFIGAIKMTQVGA
jgi:hypothetical protein